MTTDPHRLRQVLKNLLSNAFKFTERGEVSLRMALSAGGWSPEPHAARPRRPRHRASSSPTPASASRRTCTRRCSRRSRRPTGRPPASTAAPGSGSRSAATWSTCSAGRSRSTASPERAARSPSTCRSSADDGRDRPTRPHCSAVARRARRQRAAARDRQPAMPRRRGRPQRERRRADGERSASSTRAAPRARPCCRRRRLPQHLRADRAARAREARASSRPRAAPTRSTILEQQARHRHRADGHHDAGDGRLRDDGADPRAPELADLPIIAVTGKVVGGERERCLAAGASDYIPKPVDTAELLDALSEWFPGPTPRSRRSARAMSAAVDGDCARRAAILVVDDNAGKRLVDHARSSSRSVTRSSRPTRERLRCAR